MARATSTRAAALLLLLSVLTSEAFEIEDIAPGHKVVAQIGKSLVLNCRTTGCKTPDFSWRTQLDYPLGGTMSIQGPNSLLTLKSVGIENEQDYLCNAICGNKRREKKVRINIYSFPYDPVIEIIGPLVLGKSANIACHVPEVYPVEQLVLSLKKEDKILPVEESSDKPFSTTLETKTVKFTFTPTKEDAGKEITCIAELPLEDVDFEPKERKTTHILYVNFGPMNTRITAFPGSTLSRGETLILSCVTESLPPAKIVWKKQLANETIQFIEESYNLTIPNVQFWNSGIYICEASNNVTKEVESKTVSVFIQGPPVHLAFSVLPATRVQEGKNVTLNCSAKSNPPAHVMIIRKSAGGDVILESHNGVVHIPMVDPTDAGEYECQVKNEFGEDKMTRSLHVEYGPTNTTIIVIPSTIVKEGDIVTMICSTYGNPTPRISWKKQLSNGGSRPISEDSTLTLKNVQLEDMSHYECEGINQAGKDSKAVELIVQVFSTTTPALTDTPEILTEVEDFTVKSTTYNIPHQEADKQNPMENEISATPMDTSLTIYTAVKNDTVTYAVNIFDDKNGTEEIEIIFARLGEPDYVISIIIVVSSLVTAAGSVAVLWIYISRKTKFNRSYSLVNSLKPKV